MQDENPYAAPEFVGRPITGILSGQREDLRKVAVYQKGILICILISLLCLLGRFVLPVNLLLALMIVWGVVNISSTVFVFLLSIQVYGIGVGILLSILALVPCLGLLILLMVNQRATGILQANGVPVGLLGADLSRI